MPNLKSLTRKKVLILKDRSSLYEAARSMTSKGVGCALVSDGNGHITGLVTDRDITCNGFGNKLTAKDPISQVMTKQLIFINEDKTLTDAIHIMQEFGIRRLPIVKTLVNGKNRAVGILSFDDLVLSGEVSVEDLRKIVKSQFAGSKKKTIRSKVPNAQLGLMLPKELQPVMTM